MRMMRMLDAGAGAPSGFGPRPAHGNGDDDDDDNNDNDNMMNMMNDIPTPVPPVVSSRTSAATRNMTLGKYVVASVAAAGAMTYHAFATREQFYPALIYLATSKVAVVLLGNLALAALLVLGQILKVVFLGTLRDAEVERLWERAKDAVMETCLAMTIFREEFNATFVALFSLLIFVKTFHWLSQDRLEHIETTPAISRATHVRTVTLLALLLSVDVLFLSHAVTATWRNGPSMLVLFAFEYVILASGVVATAVKYAMGVIDSMTGGRWESKGIYVFYLELITDLLHLFVYLVFFLIVFAYYGLPLHLVRDLWWTFRSFRARVADFVRYRRATAHMNEVLTEATAEDLQADSTCIICREEMVARGWTSHQDHQQQQEGDGDGPPPPPPPPRAASSGTAGLAKKLPCGHCFHHACLRSWLERQQSCPTCRAPVAPTTPSAAAPAAAAAAAAAAAGGGGAGAGGDAGAAGAGAGEPQAPPPPQPFGARAPPAANNMGNAQPPPPPGDAREAAQLRQLQPPPPPPTPPTPTPAARDDAPGTPGARLATGGEPSAAPTPPTPSSSAGPSRQAGVPPTPPQHATAPATTGMQHLPTPPPGGVTPTQAATAAAQVAAAMAGRGSVRMPGPATPVSASSAGVPTPEQHRQAAAAAAAAVAATMAMLPLAGAASSPSSRPFSPTTTTTTTTTSGEGEVDDDRYLDQQLELLEKQREILIQQQELRRRRRESSTPTSAPTPTIPDLTVPPSPPESTITSHAVVNTTEEDEEEQRNSFERLEREAQFDSGGDIDRARNELRRRMLARFDEEAGASQ
ncbi:ubiquitin-protein ligase [Pycnococcus provasolii]